MLWGYFSAAGPGRLVKVEGNMNPEKYRQILEDNLSQSARELRLGRRFIFQQDNDPKHTAKTTQKWFKENKVNVLEWPSQRPDLNSNREFVAGLEKSCSRPIPRQPDRAWAVLQGRMEKNCSVQMCQPDWDISTQPQCCDCSQRCIYQTLTWRGWILMQSFTLPYIFLINYYKLFCKNLFSLWY